MNKKHIKNLVVIGGGLLRKGETLHIDEFIAKLPKKKNPKVIFIPIASNNLRDYIRVFEKTYKELGANVETIELSDKIKIDKSLKDKIISSDIIYFGGGDVDSLKKWINKKSFIKIIQTAYDKGVVISGLSAGTVVWYDYFLEKINNEFKIKKGIGWIKGLMIPHFEDDEELIKVLTEKARKNKIIAIEDNCAVYYQDNKIIEIIGSKKSNSFVFDIKKNKFSKVL